MKMSAENFTQGAKGNIKRFECQSTELHLEIKYLPE